MIDRRVFFDAIRAHPFGGFLTVDQVNGCIAILDEWERRPNCTDLRWLAYMLATAYHETDRTMQPIREIGKGKGHPYGRPIKGHVYYGRGYVQLTWDYNYKKLGDLLHVDLLNNPDKALDPKIAAGVMFEGMIRGLFTGKRLANYFTAETSDWYNARKIINGLDRAELIAGYARAFHAALLAAQKTGKGVSSAATPSLPPQPDPPPPPVKPASSGFWASLGSIFKRKG